MGGGRETHLEFKLEKLVPVLPLVPDVVSHIEVIHCCVCPFFVPVRERKPPLLVPPCVKKISLPVGVGDMGIWK